MANNGRVETLLTARDNASPTIQKFKGELQGLDKAARTAGQGLGAIAGGIALGAALAGIQQLGSAIVDLAQGAARLETLRNSFDGLAAGVGQSSAEMLAALREASAGMIADRDLLLAANKAMLLGVADSTEDIIALMDIARVRGAAMGLSMTQAFDNIVTGLGRGSALILDNLGIMVDLDRVNREYADSIGKTVSALTTQEQKQALVNSVMREAGAEAAGATDSLSESARAIGSMGAAWQNLRDQLGALVSPAVATAMQGLADALNGVNSAITQVQTTSAQKTEIFDATLLRQSVTQLEQDLAKFVDAGLVGTDEWAAKVAELQAVYAELGLVFDSTTGQWVQGIGAATAAYAQAESALAKVAEENRQTAIAASEADHAISATTQALLDQIAKLNTVGGALDAYSSKLRGMATSLAGVIGIGGALSSLKAEEEQIRRNVAAYEAMGWSSEQIALVVSATGEQVAGQWQEIIDAPAKAAAEAEKAARQGASAYQKMVNDAQAAYDSFVGRVQGVLQGGLSLDGINVDDMLPREDAINENARRLAAIANEGLIGQDWLEQFKSQVPDIYQALVDSGDPKTAAAQLLRDFQDGLVPDLLDKEKAKDLVKRAMTGEANMAALAQEIAAELAQEMGTSLQQAQAAAYSALGVKAADGAGGIGDAAAAELNNEQTLQGMARAGVEAAATWGAAFLDRVAQGVPGQLIEMLTTLITPQVQAKLQATQTQTGAQ